MIIIHCSNFVLKESFINGPSSAEIDYLESIISF